MPEGHDSGKDPGKKERRFINEKVVKPPISRRSIALRLAMSLCAAVVLGVVAGVSFVVAKPFVERYLGPEEPQNETISIPKDELTEPVVVSEPVPTEPEVESEPIEEQVQSVMENYDFTVDDLNSMLAGLRAEMQEAAKGIVAVHSVQQDVDWFNNPVETTGLYAGAVIARTEQEILILTPDAAVESADSIKVTIDDVDVDGRMKQKDATTGMAIVYVDVAALDADMLNSIGVLTLGNSYSVREGDLVVAVGCPAGVIHSMDYGFISYTFRSAEIVDGTVREFYTDVMANSEKGTFLLNTSGELIGWIRGDVPGTNGRVAEVMGISDYKGILERLSNGLAAPLFGIVGQEVTQSMSESGLPDGIYVLSAPADSPAYNAGIQNGDIITSIDGSGIATIREFQNLVDGLEVGQLVNVTVERNGREEYTQLQFQVSIGAR
ncbi:MAG: S1C family serine protease [Clostridiales bacterium]|nr:S1C family serine protease [Clostridiales bacterium]